MFYTPTCLMSGVNWNVRNWILRHSSRPMAKRGPDPAGVHPPTQKQQCPGARRPLGCRRRRRHCCFCLGGWAPAGSGPRLTSDLLECPRIQVLRFQLGPLQVAVKNSLDIFYFNVPLPAVLGAQGAGFGIDIHIFQGGKTSNFRIPNFKRVA